MAQGPFGLHELIRGLRGTRFKLGDEQARQLAASLVRALVADGRGRLCALSWPGLEIMDGQLPTGVLDDARTWSEGNAGSIVALAPGEADLG